MKAPLDEVWLAPRTIPLAAILGTLRRGAGDPTMVVAERQLWWAVVTPHGPAATWWQLTPDRHGVHVRGWGPGASWFAGRIGTVLGDADDIDDFRPQHPLLRDGLRQSQHRDWRVPKTGLVLNSLIPSIFEQKVTGKQAFGGYRMLVRRHGTPAPWPEAVICAAGPAAASVGRMCVPPSVEAWRAIPSWEWLKAAVEPPQSKTIMRVLAVAPRLEETATMPLKDAHARLRAVPGVGVWTAAKVAQTAWGDADAPTFGDFHIAKQIGYALTGRDADDAGMARLLEPFRPHRFRAERLILSVGPARPRRGERMALPRHLPRWS